MKHFRENVRIHSFAHSGALLSGDDEIQGNALHGEVPSPWPTVSAQIRNAPKPKTKVVRILIEGGINEVGGSKIANPTTSPSYIESATRAACGALMKEVLKGFSAKFPGAEIYLLGYYQILADRTDGSEVGMLLEEEGVRSESIDDQDLDFVERAVENSQSFRELSDRFLGLMANEIDSLHDGRCVFVPSGMSEREGMFGEPSLLFHPWSRDEMFGIRARHCTSALRQRRTGVHCYLAATAHPNELGVDRYVSSITKALSETRSDQRM
ncbi:MAG: hypothetical protein ACSHX7_10295 [Luteolibacter sp.]